MSDRPDLSLAEIRLVPVLPAMRAAIAGLRVAAEQAAFVATNAASLKEADRDEDARPRAVLADDGAGERPVGFLMYDASEGDEAKIYRFMIDRAEQGRGYGKAALQAALAEIGALGHIAHVSICYEPENTAAQRMYAKAGFIEQGLDEDGEMIARLDLRKAPA